MLGGPGGRQGSGGWQGGSEQPGEGSCLGGEEIVARLVPDHVVGCGHLACQIRLGSKDTLKGRFVEWISFGGPGLLDGGRAGYHGDAEGGMGLPLSSLEEERDVGEEEGGGLLASLFPGGETGFPHPRVEDVLQGGAARRVGEGLAAHQVAVDVIPVAQDLRAEEVCQFRADVGPGVERMDGGIRIVDDRSGPGLGEQPDKGRLAGGKASGDNDAGDGGGRVQI